MPRLRRAQSHASIAPRRSCGRLALQPDRGDPFPDGYSLVLPLSLQEGIGRTLRVADQTARIPLERMRGRGVILGAPLGARSVIHLFVKMEQVIDPREQLREVA